MSFAAFSAMSWTEQNMLFHVALEFGVGFAGAQALEKRTSQKSPGHPLGAPLRVPSPLTAAGFP